MHIHTGNGQAFSDYLKKLAIKRHPNDAWETWQNAKVSMDHNVEPIYHWYGPEL